MEIKSLLLGLLVSVGLFSAKAGMGLGYYLGQTASRSRRIAVLSAYLALYGILFLGAGFWIERTDPMGVAEAVQSFLQSGILIHALMAALLLIWGLLLLRSQGKKGAKTLGWLPLTLPCPVCLTVILISVGTVMALFPGQGRTVVFALFGGFLLISLISLGLTLALTTTSRQPAEHLLGSAMLIIAAYFLLSVLVMPQFAETDEIFRLALHTAQPAEDWGASAWAGYLAPALTFVFGFCFTRYRIRRIA